MQCNVIGENYLEEHHSQDIESTQWKHMNQHQGGLFEFWTMIQPILLIHSHVCDIDGHMGRHA